MGNKFKLSVCVKYKFYPLSRCLCGVVSYVIPVLLFVALTTRGCYAACESKRQVNWRNDGRCGSSFPLPHSNMPAQCDPDSDRPCCSDYGYCGNSPSHCRCSACVDFRDSVKDTPKCHYVLDQKSGYLKSPGYPHGYPPNQECCYDIKRPTNDFCGVSLLVEELDVGRGEEDGYCQKDWISLPSCVPERGTRICGNTTGQYFQYLFQPGAESIRFKFLSGIVQETRNKFKIKYELLRTCPGPFQTQYPPISVIPGVEGSPPCYTRITDRRGTINTPFFPDPYPGNLDCVYEFIRTDERICGVEMTSVRFHMEEPISTPFGGACTDFFHLPSCGFLCGTVNFSWLVNFQPGATSLKFHLHSNGNETSPRASQGFLINFEQVINC